MSTGDIIILAAGMLVVGLLVLVPMCMYLLWKMLETKHQASLESALVAKAERAEDAVQLLGMIRAKPKEPTGSELSWAETAALEPVVQIPDENGHMHEYELLTPDNIHGVH